MISDLFSQLIGGICGSGFGVWVVLTAAHYFVRWVDDISEAA